MSGGLPLALTEWAWWAVALGVAVYAAYVAVYLVLQRRSPQATLAWLLLLTFLPGVGLVLYYLIGLRVTQRRRRRQRALATVAARGEHEPGAPASEDLGPEACQLSRVVGKMVGPAGALRRGRARLLLGGAEKYAAVGEAIGAARHHVHVEYYIWEPDTAGTRLRDQLIEAARRGAQVRVLVDGFGAINCGERFWAPLRQAGAKIARFSPAFFRRWTPRMANFRTHRKIVVVDGRVAFTGGMNVSDVHDASVRGEDAWRDTHLEVRGLACHGLQMVFLEDWYFATGEAPRGHVYFPLDETPGGVPIQVVSSGPDEQFEATHRLFFTAITLARRRVLLTTAYFVPDEALLQALMSAALRGVDVRVLVPERGDILLVSVAAKSYYQELVQAGVKLLEYERPVLHAKTLVIDDSLAFVGSCNFDNRSFRLNFEVGCALYEPGFCAELAAAFARDQERGREVDARQLHRVRFLSRLLQATARLLAPLL